MLQVLKQRRISARSKTAMQLKVVRQEEKESGTRKRPPSRAVADQSASMSASPLNLQRKLGSRLVSQLLRSSSIQAKLTIGEPGDQYEQEADRVAEQVMRMPAPDVQSKQPVQIQRACSRCEEKVHRQAMDGEEKFQTTEISKGASSLSRQALPGAAPSGNRPHISRDAGPTLRRWSISGDIATSDREGDTLGALALSVGGRFNDWKCIKPVSMRTFKSPGAAAKYGDRYERFVQIGDEFDVSNLTATTGKTLRIYLFSDSTEAKDAALAKLFYPGSVSSSSPDSDIEGAAGFGSTPIHEFLIFGHSSGDSMWGGAGSFRPADFDPEDPPPSFGQAERGFFPRRCWFTRQASARSVGCSSEDWGRDFAAHYLRKGAQIVTTTASVRPKCKVAASGGGCASYDGVDFATSPSPSATSLEGPFWSASDFHAGSHWSTIAGKL
jgi:hypothetical protein